MAQQLDPSIFGDSSKPLCRFDGCDRRLYQGGLCCAHYKRKLRGLPMDAPIRRAQPGRPCVIDGCHYPRLAAGLCRTHYERRRTGNPDWSAPIRLRVQRPARLGALSIEADVMEVLDQQAKLLRVTRKELARIVLRRWAKDVTSRRAA